MARKIAPPVPKPVGDVEEKVKRSWVFDGQEFFNQRDAHVARMIAVLQARAEKLGIDRLDMEDSTLRSLLQNAEHFTPMLEEFCAKMEALELTPKEPEESE